MVRKGSSDSDWSGEEFTVALSLHLHVFQSSGVLSPQLQGGCSLTSQRNSATFVLPFYFVLFTGFSKDSAVVTIKSFKSRWFE